MSDTSVRDNGSSRLSESRDASDIQVADVGFGQWRADEGDRTRLNGLRVFCALHGLPIGRSQTGPVPDEVLTPAHLATGVLRFAQDKLIRIADLWFTNSRCLRLRVDVPPASAAAQPLTWDVYQTDLRTGGLLCLASRPMSGARLGFLDVVLRNPFLPVLVTVRTGGGEVVETGVLPFPSLCRGGLHYAELCDFGSAASLLTDLAALSQRLVSSLLALRSGATKPLIGDIASLARGVDDVYALLSSDMRAWLGWLVPGRRLTISTVDENGRIEPGGRRDEENDGALSEGLTLDLPQASLPSLQALLAPNSGMALGTAIGSFLVAEGETGHPLWAVGMPRVGRDILDLQPLGAARPFPLLRGGDADTGKSGITDMRAPSIPLAIKFVDTNPLGRKITLLAPVSPAVLMLLPTSLEPVEGRITVIIPACGRLGDGLKALVESLAQQTASSRMDVVAIVSADDPFERLDAEGLLGRTFPGRFVLLASTEDMGLAERLALSVAHLRSDFVMVVHRSVTLHDRRTVSTLVSLASQERIGSASCMLIRAGLSKKEKEIVFHSAGLFPVVTPDGDVARALDCQQAFPLATYPVAANAPVLQMISARALSACGGLSAGSGDETGFQARATALGLFHVCTTGVSAGLRVEAAPVADRSAIDNAVRASDRFPLSAGLRALRG
ncbi:hypothetical protein [Neorhizobium sp. AL 9.2.2]|uniref:hypothetical protein n=1 Tax=Neorhizobium sp. AL 9.2.2 TaxID=2712894 RepID=UPI001571CF09|nr:hypothetical protein [Neorhizobium sp. AL 9.2.2]NSY19767.1 hypothetical protein [Neorhizobium sp. AL 9.2.2]